MGLFVNFGQFSIRNSTEFSRIFGAKTSLTVVNAREITKDLKIDWLSPESIAL